LAPPGAGDDREGVSVAVRVPTYWAEAADALTEVLQIAAQTDSDLRFNVRVIPAEERLTLSVEEAAALLGISRAFAYEAVNRGEIPSIRIGRRVLVPKATLQRMLGGDDDPPPSSGSGRKR
jgi:excisionase family DNA binding protein